MDISFKQKTTMKQPSVSGTGLFWKGSPRAISFDQKEIEAKLNEVEKTVFVIRDFAGRVGVTTGEKCRVQGRG